MLFSVYIDGGRGQTANFGEVGWKGNYSSMGSERRPDDPDAQLRRRRLQTHPQKSITYAPYSIQINFGPNYFANC